VLFIEAVADEPKAPAGDEAVVIAAPRVTPDTLAKMTRVAQRAGKLAGRKISVFKVARVILMQHLGAEKGP
jgi:hypothetical protein